MTHPLPPKGGQGKVSGSPYRLPNELLQRDAIRLHTTEALTGVATLSKEVAGLRARDFLKMRYRLNLYQSVLTRLVLSWFAAQPSRLRRLFIFQAFPI